MRNESIFLISRSINQPSIHPSSSAHSTDLVEVGQRRGLGRRPVPHHQRGLRGVAVLARRGAVLVVALERRVQRREERAGGAAVVEEGLVFEWWVGSEDWVRRRMGERGFASDRQARHDTARHGRTSSPASSARRTQPASTEKELLVLMASHSVAGAAAADAAAVVVTAAASADRSGRGRMVVACRLDKYSSPTVSEMEGRRVM